MLDKTLVIVPARSGSKGIPNKNIQLIHKKPLLSYSIEFALQAGFKHVYISTDSLEYESLAVSFGAKSIGLREASLATDDAKTVDVVIDLYQKLKQPFQYILLLQPTAPQRSLSDIDELSQLIAEPNINSIVSVSKLEEPHPFKLKTVSKEGMLSSFLPNTSSEVPRQRLTPVYKLNGAYYFSKSKTLLACKSFFPENQTKAFVMDDIINVDTSIDLIALERKLKKTF
tara:strand:+ start:2984 stop:3667 length:684 start_codon:yes stop_codon:yes gene_type:complete